MNPIIRNKLRSLRGKNDPTAQVECYGEEYDRSEKCVKCRLRKWCKEAGNPKNLTYLQVSPSVAHKIRAPTKGQPYIMLAFVRWLLTISSFELEIIKTRILNPSISVTDIAKHHKVSRQYVAKMFKKISVKYPQLKPILLGRKQGGLWSVRNPTFP